MKRRRITGSGLNAYLDDQAIPLQQLRTVRRCQRKVGALMDELNEVAKHLATIWMRFPPGTSTGTPLGEAVKTIDVMLFDGDQVAGWLDDWVLACQANERAREQAQTSERSADDDHVE
jgi:hypothetical protein